MMLSEITSPEVKTEIPPFQHEFVRSSEKEIGKGEILGWVLIHGGKILEKRFFPKLPSILQIDYSSSIYPQFPEFKTETALSEDFFKKEKLRKTLKDISKMLDEMLVKEELKNINKEKLLNSISKILHSFTLEQLEIPTEELFRRIERVVVLEAAYGVLNELNPEEIKEFDEAVKRRTLFK